MLKKLAFFYAIVYYTNVVEVFLKEALNSIVIKSISYSASFFYFLKYSS